jgi:hypothetical protein
MLGSAVACLVRVDFHGPEIFFAKHRWIMKRVPGATDKQDFLVLGIALQRGEDGLLQHHPIRSLLAGIDPKSDQESMQLGANLRSED